MWCSGMRVPIVGRGMGGVGREKVCLQMTNTVKLLLSKEHNTGKHLLVNNQHISIHVLILSAYCTLYVNFIIKYIGHPVFSFSSLSF